MGDGRLERSLRLQQRGLEGPGVYLEEPVPLADQLPVLEVDRFDVPGHPGFEVDVAYGVGGARLGQVDRVAAGLEDLGGDRGVPLAHELDGFLRGIRTTAATQKQGAGDCEGKDPGTEAFRCHWGPPAFSSLPDLETWTLMGIGPSMLGMAGDQSPPVDL